MGPLDIHVGPLQAGAAQPCCRRRGQCQLAYPGTQLRLIWILDRSLPAHLKLFDQALRLQATKLIVKRGSQGQALGDGGQCGQVDLVGAELAALGAFATGRLLRP